MMARHLLERPLRIQEHDVPARDHHLARQHIVEMKHRIEKLEFRGGQLAHLFPQLHIGLNLILGDRLDVCIARKEARERLGDPDDR